MKRPLPKRSNLFLMEMILAILFFSLASAVCMQLFAQARLLSQETSAKNHAMLEAKSTAAVFESGDGTLESLLEHYPKSRLSGSTLTVCYDKDWNSCEPAASAYKMQVQLQQKTSQLSSVSIQMYDLEDSELFSLEADCYQPIKAVIQ